MIESRIYNMQQHQHAHTHSLVNINSILNDGVLSISEHHRYVGQVNNIITTGVSVHFTSCLYTQSIMKYVLQPHLRKLKIETTVPMNIGCIITFFQLYIFSLSLLVDRDRQLRVYERPVWLIIQSRLQWIIRIIQSYGHKILMAHY